MRKPLVIFGSGDMAELAHYYFVNDSGYQPVAFTVDRAFLKNSECCGLPVVEFEDILQKYPPETHDLFIALSYSKLNQVRRDRYETAKKLGYSLASYISSHATVLNGGDIGDNCFILEDNTIQPFAQIGDNVTLWSGNHVGHHSIISNHCFIASHVVISGGVNIGEQCFIGVNATLRDHIAVGQKSVIGAGVLLLKSCEAESLYIGARDKPRARKSSELRKI
jgi:sugar O-acyltransferase (sialic acid O-acetyltransferase NeuD family)